MWHAGQIKFAGMIFKAVLCECFGCPSGFVPVFLRAISSVCFFFPVYFTMAMAAHSNTGNTQGNTQIFTQTFLYWAVLPGFIG